MQEQLQTIIASYFRYWGPEVAEMLEKVDDYKKQKRIVNAFWGIIEDDLWEESNDSIAITAEVDEDIAEIVNVFIKLWYLDKLATTAILKCLEKFTI